MQEIDTLLHAKWIIPVQPDQVALENHSLVVHNGRIVDLLPRQECALRYQADTVVALDSHALIPGLINAHTHAAMTLLRGLADDMPLMAWLEDHIWPAEMRWVNEEFVQCGTQLAMAEMLRGGISCFNDMYYFPDVVARTAVAAGMRACVGLIVVDFPTNWANDPEEYISKGLAVHDQYRSNPLVRTAFAPHAPYTVSDQPLKRIGILANELEIPIHIHVHETAHEVEQAVAKTGMRPLERLNNLGLLSPALLAVHMTQLTSKDIEIFAASGARLVHCPESNIKLASGLCPVQKLEQAGILVALGTDGAASNNNLDLFGEMRTAALLGKAISNDASALPAHQVLRMATLHGAIALGIGEETGSLVPGKWADITAVRMDEVETQPVYHPISQLVYATGREHVTDVWIAGRQLLKERQLTTLDVQDILHKTRVWQARIADSDSTQH
ncbi:MAG: TRZ/ATZ family hydrolase [Gammaproteobacteria bacterium]